MSGGERVKIPNAAVPFILLQRTALRRELPLLRKLGVSDERAVRIEAVVHRGWIKQNYTRIIRQEFDSIRPHLPEAARRALDIGCGIALLDLHVASHYRETGSDVCIHLLDRSETAYRAFYGFKEHAAFYNSLALSRELLTNNGVARDRIRLHDAGAPDELEGLRFDLVLSLLSWGFHFPVETYLEHVRRSLAPGGRLILDVRKQTEGLDRLRGAFANVHPVLDRDKYLRIVARND